MLLIRSLLASKTFFKAPIKSRLSSVIAQAASTSAKDVNNDEGPVKYSKSPASKWKAASSRSGDPNPRLWYEPPVIIISLTVFMIYFCILREENGIDQELGKTLYSRIEGLEEHQLRVSLKYNQENGMDTTEILGRLKELEDARGHSVTTVVD